MMQWMHSVDEPLNIKLASVVVAAAAGAGMRLSECRVDFGEKEIIWCYLFGTE